MKNKAHFDDLLQGLQTDLVVLPEMFTTGFSMNPNELAEEEDGPTLAWLKAKARELDAAITGSVIIREKGKYYNRLFFVLPNGNYQTYNKRHLFTYAGEHHHYTAGSNKLTLDYKGWKICPMVCYDLRFPVWSRNTEDYDLLIYVANWPERRNHPWKSLLVARAIENQCYTIGLNRVGEDGNGISHSGDSIVLDPLGEKIAAANPLIEEVITTQISKAELQKVRDRFQFLADRDEFTLK
jgi:predicted amidohydrolase